MTFWLCRQQIHSRWSNPSSCRAQTAVADPHPARSDVKTPSLFFLQETLMVAPMPVPAYTQAITFACLYKGSNVCLQGQQWLVTSHLVLSPRKWWWARQMPSSDQLLHVKARYSWCPTALASAHTNIFISTQIYLYPHKQEATCLCFPLKWRTQPLSNTKELLGITFHK